MTDGATPEASRGIDVRRLLLLVAIIVGGVVYVFWDDVRDVLRPPDIVPAREVPAAAREENLVRVRSGPLEVTFTRIGAAITHMTWTDPADGHVETLVSQKGVPNRALLVELPGREGATDRPFRLVAEPRERREGAERFTEVRFVQKGFDDGLEVRKVFRVYGADRPPDQAPIELEVALRGVPLGDPLHEQGYTLRIANAVGDPSELGKDDGLISVRSDGITDHHRVRRVSGRETWPTEEERKRAGHGHREGTPTLEWVATATKYFGLIVRPEGELTGAEMTFTRTADTAAAVELHVPPSDVGVRTHTVFGIYAGPKEYGALAALPGRQQEAIDYWYFGRLTTVLLAWLHDRVVANYGVAIVIITILFRLLMWPVTRYHLRSLVDIRLANAKLEAIDAREPPRSETEARAAWLKEARVWENVQRRATIGVFLPMLILLPVLLVLYHTLDAGYEFHREPLLLWITDITKRDPYFVLPVLMGLAMMGQMATMSENRARERSWIVMPAAFTVIFAFFSAGLVLFWLVDTLASWGQLALVRRGRKREVEANAPCESSAESTGD